MTAVQPQPDIDLGALKELCEKATPGPWCALYPAGGMWSDSCDDMVLGPLLAPRPFDADFIATARTAIPALIAEVERLREALVKVRSRAASALEYVHSDLQVHRNALNDVARILDAVGKEDHE